MNKKSKKDAGERHVHPGPAFLIALPVLAILGLIIYSNSFGCEFHLDDNPGILMNSTIRNLSDIRAIWESNNSRFIGNLSLAFNYKYGAYEVYGYHVFNLVIHLINACLVFLLSSTLFRTPMLKSHPIAQYKGYFAFFMALLFVSHPLATGSVTYIIQRLASMVTMFYLLSVIGFIRGRLAESVSSRVVYYSVAVASAFAAFLTKENAFTLPVALLLTEIFFFRDKVFLKRLPLKYWLMVFGGLALLVTLSLTWFSTSIFKTIEPELGNTYTLTPVNYLMTQFSVIVKYIQLLLVPVGLNVDYDWPVAQSLLEPRTLISLLVLLGILSFAVYLFNRNRLASFGIFWFFLTLVIESSIVPISDVIFEHRTYLPSFGFFIAFCTLIFGRVWPNSRMIGLLVLLSLTGVYSSLTYARNKVWKNEETLWLDCIPKSPGKARPKVNLGKYYVDRQETEKAYPLFIAAEKINGSYFDAVQNSGVCEIAFGRFDEALAHLDKALELDSTNVRTHFASGLAYQGKQDWPEAVRCYSNAIRINPNFVKSYAKRGYAYGSLKNWDAAIKDYDKACELEPRNFEAFFELGNLYGINKNYPEAVENYDKAISINTSYTEAYLYRAISHEHLNHWAQAVADYEAALRLDPANQLAKANKERIEAFFKAKGTPVSDL